MSSLRYPPASEKANEIFEAVVNELPERPDDHETVNIAKQLSLLMVKHLIAANPNLPFSLSSSHPMTDALRYWRSVEKQIQSI